MFECDMRRFYMPDMAALQEAMYQPGLGTLSTGSGSGTGFLFPDPICWSGRQVRVFQSPSVGQGDRSVLSGQETGPETGF